MFTLTPMENLLSTSRYMMILTSNDAATAGTTDGLDWPQAPGLYRVDMAVSNNNFQSQYIEVFGTSFSTISCYSYVVLEKEYNYLDITLVPATAIDSTNDAIVIELPTKSSNGANIFNDDLDLGLKDFDPIPVDAVTGAPIAAMKCIFQKGYQTNGNPCKVICSEFTAIAAGTTIRFVIRIRNPDIAAGTDLSIPITIYSQDNGENVKTNFNVLTEGIYVDETQTANLVTSAVSVTPSTLFYGDTGKNLVLKNEDTSTTVNYANFDVFIVVFGQPLYRQGLQTSKFTYAAGTGDVIYLKSMNAAILVPATANPIATGDTTLTISTVWDNP